MKKQINIQELNVKEASLQEYQALRKLMDVVSKERQPDDPVVPLEETINQLKNIPSFMELKMWCVWDDDHANLLAQGNVALIYTDDNRHLSQYDIIVHPSSRQQGIGKHLLGLIAEAASADNRRLLVTDTNDRVPAGEAFMHRIGAKRGLEGHINQLRIEELDKTLIRKWLEQGSMNEDQFELGLWESEYPEDKLEEIAQLIELTNQQPLGDLEIEEMHFNPEQLREMEKMDLARGNLRYTFYVLEKATGKFAGYTETVWNANRPEILRQDMTGVYPQYRGKGLGRWLKAAMLEKMLKIHPEIKFVRTQNADSNAAMLRINNELGFKPYMTNILWQMEIEQVRNYVNNNNSRRLYV